MQLLGKSLATASLLIFASCSTPSIKLSAQTGDRAIASDVSIDQAAAASHLSDGVPFSISCSKSPAGARDVTLEFYASGSAGESKTEKFVSQYSSVDLLLKNTNKLAEAKSSGANRIIRSGDYQYWITPYSIRKILGQNNKPAYIEDVRYTLYGTCGELRSELTENGFYADASFKVLSVVGPYLSTEVVVNGYTGGAHPYAGRNYSSVNTDKITVSETNANTRSAKANYNVFDLANDADIAAALKGDTFLQRKLGPKLAGARTTADIHKMMVVKFNSGCDMYVPDDINSAFSQLAIFDYSKEQNRMQVRVGFSYGCEAARGNFVQLGLSLKPTASFTAQLNSELQSALDQGRKPYFMRYSGQLK